MKIGGFDVPGTLAERDAAGLVAAGALGDAEGAHGPELTELAGIAVVVALAQGTLERLGGLVEA